MEKLEKQLGEYILETLKYTETVKEFCDGESKWTLQRGTELDKMRDIKDRADQITLKIDHVQKAENKGKALVEYMWNSLTQVTADSRKQELEKELGEVLKNTLEGLEKLHHFLNAVEKLAVTSLFVFMGESFMPRGVSSMPVRSVISAARMVSPLLVHFKRDAGLFFLPNLFNIEVLAFQLDKYICVTQQICKMMEKIPWSISHCRSVHEWKTGKTSLKFNLKPIKESVYKLYEHLDQLIKIRKDELFRLNFIFGVKAQDFIKIFSERHCRMFQFLSDFEKASVQLDKMKKRSNISTVTGSSVGLGGCVLSIVGLALAPVSAGTSLGFTLAGGVLGITSNVTSIVTGIAEMRVNKCQGENADNAFIRFMKDGQKILDCMEDVARAKYPISHPQAATTVFEVGKLFARVVAVGKGIAAIVDGASAVKSLRTDELIERAIDLGLHGANAGQSIPHQAAEWSDIKQLAKGTPLALSQPARVGLIGLNALFIGLDVISICKSGTSLTKGSKSEVAQFIPSRAALWRSEVEAWQKIHNYLFEGISGFNKNREILDKPFHI